MISVTRRSHFNAAHRLHNPDWTDEKNVEFYGDCNNKNFHGHNYDLEVTITGEMNSESGYLIDMKELSDLIYNEIELRFDHKNLNLDTIEFKNLIPTAENISIVIWKILRTKIDKMFILKIRLYETPRNFVEYSGD
ncbi:MAG: 6-pyruvoyl trahydropterin synthase family protein [Thermodesulfobacteriota bacterium]|jgi:6-pyruvoyltetrahydropterin/6-carboxytetrahydropterin synthase|nr:6-carboxytetrahydropterin synthase [Thermodesulfobacteriota bacterium]RZP13894.1 MAG: 6-carboxytetrahydropterin synthase [Candidatus Dadabacteria bacterium]